MQTLNIKPSGKYLKKLRLILTIVFFIAVIFGLIISAVIAEDEGSEAGSAAFVIFLIIDLAWWIPSMILVGTYYRSLRYEIQDDEVIVHVGIVTKSVKHVPYRTVTNITTRRGLFDRYLFNIGSLNIQTAGMSGQTGAEESLVGLDDVKEVYEIIVGKLRSFRGGMAPDAAGVDAPEPAVAGDQLSAILEELKAIRRNTEK